jgi:hypothetical protein
VVAGPGIKYLAGGSRGCANHPIQAALLISMEFSGTGITEPWQPRTILEQLESALGDVADVDAERMLRFGNTNGPNITARV